MLSRARTAWLGEMQLANRCSLIGCSSGLLLDKHAAKSMVAIARQQGPIVRAKSYEDRQYGAACLHVSVGVLGWEVLRRPTSCPFSSAGGLDLLQQLL